MISGHVRIGMSPIISICKDDDTPNPGRNPPLAYALSRLASIKRDIDHALC